VTFAQLRVQTASDLQSPTLAVLVGLFLRMALLWLIHREHDAYQLLFFPSSHEAWNVAWSMVLGNGFSSPLAGMHGPTAWVAPLYPSLIALGLKLSGNDGYVATLFCLSLNCLMSALTCWPIYRIARKIARHEVALVCCWAWIFLPTAVIFPLSWLWDPSFSAFLVALLIDWTLDLPAASSVLPWLRYGAVWGVAVLMNPAVGILFPFLVFWLVQRRFQGNLPWRPQVSSAILLFGLCLLPWTARNFIALGRIVPVKDNLGLELWLGNNPDVKKNWNTAHHPGSDLFEMQQLLDLGEASYMALKERQAIEFIEGHPRFFLKSVLYRVVDTWTGLGDVPSDRWVNTLHASTAYVWITSAVSIFAFGGFYLTWRSSKWEAAPIWITPIVFPVTYYMTHTSLRYRHPIDPVLTVLAVCALARICSFVWRRNPAQATSGTLQPN
jgi:hypothetical protein